MPKRKPDGLTGVRLELQEAERNIIESLLLQKQIGTATSAYESILKPFFGSGDQGILLTFIVASIIDEQVIPDDTIVDFFIDDATQKVVKKAWVTILKLGGGDPMKNINREKEAYASSISAISTEWGNLTEEQKNQLKPILTSISRSAKMVKYYTGLYLGAKLGTNLLDAIVPFA
jgi:hypothetical protein